MYLFTMTDACNNGVRSFLEELHLGHYWDIFKAKGYDRETDIKNLDDKDLEEMRIPPSERQCILKAGM